MINFPISVFRSFSADALTFGCGFLHHLVLTKNTFVLLLRSHNRNILNILIKEQMHLEVLFNLIWPTTNQRTILYKTSPSSSIPSQNNVHRYIYVKSSLCVNPSWNRILLTFGSNVELFFSKSVVFGRW